MYLLQRTTWNCRHSTVGLLGNIDYALRQHQRRVFLGEECVLVYDERYFDCCWLR